MCGVIVDVVAGTGGTSSWLAHFMLASGGGRGDETCDRLEAVRGCPRVLILLSQISVGSILEVSR